MSSSSTHLGLVKPVTGDAVSVLRTSISSNADTVDTAFGRVSGALQEGVIDAGSHMVTQKGAGANMSVDVASSTGSGVYVQDDSVSSQALYYVAPTVAVTNVSVTAQHATLPRVDRVVVAMDGTISVVAGTATSGATLDNLTGAAGVPSSKLLLADVLVAPTAANGGAIPNSAIRDRRKWARGAHYSAVVTAGNYSPSTTLTVIDSTRLSKRVECSGGSVRVRLNAPISVPAIGGNANSIEIHLYVDGSDVYPITFTSSTSDLVWNCAVNVTTPVASGSHVIEWRAKTGGGTGSILANAAAPLVFEIEELFVQNAANNTTTTG